MWNMKCTLIPVIIGATRIVTKDLKNNLKAIPGKHLTDSVQKTAILGTSHIIQKVLQSETGSMSGGNHSWFKRRSTEDKRHVTREVVIMKFHSHVLRCLLNSTKANYKTGTM
jgi:hypothetical protein